MGRRLTCCLGDFELLLKHIFLPPSAFGPARFSSGYNTNVDVSRVFRGLSLCMLQSIRLQMSCTVFRVVPLFYYASGSLQLQLHKGHF